MEFAHVLDWQIPHIRPSDIKTTDFLLTRPPIFPFAGYVRTLRF